MEYPELLNLLWRAGHFAGWGFTSAGGESVTVVSEGEQGDVTGVWLGAEIVVDGERRRGSVAVGEGASRTGPVGLSGDLILRVVDGDVPPVLGSDDRLVPQIEYRIEPEVRECYDGLRAGAAVCGCAGRIAGMDHLRRAELFTGLLVERLRRKTGRIMEIFGRAQQDWNQTFHVLLLQAMGGDKNRDVFTELAGRATATMVSREKSSLLRVEALLLGTAGFLFAAPDKDDYTLRLEEEFRHLAAKYSIVPLKPALWNLSKTYPANHPAVRLAEISALLCKKDFMLDGVLGCRTSEDVERLFAVSASDYWRTHYRPSGEPSSPLPKTIGRAKARLVGINLAVPLMFAYGKQTGGEELCERALDLPASIPAEKNSKLDGWREGGCVPGNGFESQALLELGNEYCAAGACAACRIGRTEIKKALQS